MGFPGPDAILAPAIMPQTSDLRADHPTTTEPHHMRPPNPTTDPLLTVITPWEEWDPSRGHDPRGAYVETFWLGVIGPSATWLMRRLSTELEERPEGYRIDLALVAATLGLSSVKGHSSPFGRALSRCVMFSLARPTAHGLEIRRRFPDLSPRHLSRLPPPLREAHELWQQQPAVHLHLLGLDHRHSQLHRNHQKV
jgi:hypothetical protein